MAFNANNEWVPEDDSVATRVSAITAQDSPLMRAASGMGIRQANRRGLANSSIAAGASRAETLKAAVPIASQDASQISQKNLARITGDYGLTATQLQMAQQERDNAAARISDAFNSYNSAQASVAGNTKLKANTRTAYQQSNLDVLNAQLAAFQRLYPNVNLNWGTGQ